MWGKKYRANPCHPSTEENIPHTGRQANISVKCHILPVTHCLVTDHMWQITNKPSIKQCPHTSTEWYLLKVYPCMQCFTGANTINHVTFCRLSKVPYTNQCLGQNIHNWVMHFIKTRNWQMALLKRWMFSLLIWLLSYLLNLLGHVDCFERSKSVAPLYMEGHGVVS